jgi:DNA-directed RNA polymerase specialized sigma24 family protein
MTWDDSINAMSDRAANSFQTTHWTQVIAARGKSPAAKQALRELSEIYYGPVELFIRRYRGDCQDARDLTHEFFAKLLEGNSLDNVDRMRGRFRTYLLGAVKHFLADQEDRDQTLKRGGGQTLRSLDQPSPDHSATDVTGPLAITDPHGFPPDAFFDRQWALAVVEQAMLILRAEAEANNELARFDVLQRWLVTPEDRSTAVTAARSLELTDGAFKVAVHRLRKRFRQLVVNRIAATVHDPAEVQDELNYLVGAIASPPTIKGTITLLHGAEDR